MTAPMPAMIDSAELNRRLASGAPPRVLDVRTPGEFETVHMPGSYNVPLDLLREHRDEILAHVDEDVVLVCRSGQRAAQAEETLRNAGLPNVHILDGGITAWQTNGFVVNQRGQRWDLERQVRLVAGLIVAVSILASILVPGLKWVFDLHRIKAMVRDYYAFDAWPVFERAEIPHAIHFVRGEKSNRFSTDEIDFLHSAG